MSELRIGGFTKLTTIDYPGHLAAVVFCQGCPWRCPYCHNPDLLPMSHTPQSSWEKIVTFMKKRIGLLDGIVFSGGEPTAQAALLPAVIKMKQLGFSVALHTAGAYPERLSKLLKHLDWVALDIKAPFKKYHGTTSVENSGLKARESALSILQAGLPYEFRTTVQPELLSNSALLTLAEELNIMGVKHYAVQAYRPHDSQSQTSFSAETLFSLRTHFPNLIVR